MPGTHMPSVMKARFGLVFLLAAVAFLAAGLYTARAAEKAAGLTWTDYDSGAAKAKKEGKFVLVDFYTTWCQDCKKMDKTTLADPDVIKLLGERFVTVRVDGEKQKEIASKYGVFAYPTFNLLGPDGKKIYQGVGYMSKADFVAMLEYATTGAYKTKGFKEYYKSRKK